MVHKRIEIENMKETYHEEKLGELTGQQQRQQWRGGLLAETRAQLEAPAHIPLNPSVIDKDMGECVRGFVCLPGSP